VLHHHRRERREHHRGHHHQPADREPAEPAELGARASVHAGHAIGGQRPRGGGDREQDGAEPQLGAS